MEEAQEKVVYELNDEDMENVAGGKTIYVKGKELKCDGGYTKCSNPQPRMYKETVKHEDRWDRREFTAYMKCKNCGGKWKETSGGWGGKDPFEDLKKR